MKRVIKNFNWYCLIRIFEIIWGLVKWSLDDQAPFFIINVFLNIKIIMQKIFEIFLNKFKELNNKRIITNVMKR